MVASACARHIKVLADFCGSSVSRIGLAGGCVVSSRIGGCEVFTLKVWVMMDFPEQQEWNLERRVKLQHAQQLVARRRAVLEKLRMEKDNVRLLPSATGRTGLVVHQQQQGVCRSGIMAWSGGMDVSSGGIRQIAPRAVSLQQQHQRWGRSRGAVLLQSQPRRPAPLEYTELPEYH